MSLDRLFDEVAEFLASRGTNVTRCEGQRLSQDEIDEIERTVALPLPGDFRGYLSELGDGFAFQYDWKWSENQPAEFCSWQLMTVEDLLSRRNDQQFLMQAVEKGQGASYGFGDRTAEEMERAKKRFKWLQITDSCYCFSLDTSQSPSPVHYQDINYGATEPIESSLIVGTSLNDWIHQWSRYCFSNPAPDGKPYLFETFAGRRSGLFDWAPHHFFPKLDRLAR
ncbi:MAG: hypothetical protein ACK5TH_08190 [Prosthecobacter sp.]|jgi:hypothetical protein